MSRRCDLCDHWAKLPGGGFGQRLDPNKLPGKCQQSPPQLINISSRQKNCSSSGAPMTEHKFVTEFPETKAGEFCGSFKVKQNIGAGQSAANDSAKSGVA